MGDKVVDIREAALKAKVEQWTQHPDVQIGASFFITALMMQGFSKFIFDQTIQEDDQEDKEIIESCIYQGAQNFMQGADGSAPKAFSPLQLKENTRSCLKYIDMFLAQVDGEVFDNGAKILKEGAQKIKLALEEKQVTLVAISGKKGSGKDEVSKALMPWANVKFADALKEATCKMIGCNREDLEDQDFKETESDTLGITVRDFLQRFGTEAMRDTFGENFWVQCLIPRLLEAITSVPSAGNPEVVCVTDTRFLSEADFLRECGAKILRINRDGLPEDNHASETELDNYDFDIVIENDGTLEELHEKVRENVGKV